jgi:hypothetical protein
MKTDVPGAAGKNKPMRIRYEQFDGVEMLQSILWMKVRLVT